METNSERSRREGVASMLRMFDAQEKERTATMVDFGHDTHVLRIEDDSYGYLTVRINLRRPSKLLHVIRFRKKPKLGVVYFFRNSDSLNDLSVEAALLSNLEELARAHAAEKLQKPQAATKVA